LKLRFLQEYEKEDEEAYERFSRRFQEGKSATFPPLSKFRKIGRPIAMRAIDSSIWAQIPLFRSLIVPVYPVSKNDFAEVHGFDVKDLDRLIDLCKDTGRIQLVLASNASNYAGLDYLDDMFSELKPIALRSLPLRYSSGDETVRQWATEFTKLAASDFWQVIGESLLDSGFTRYSVRQRFGDLRAAYVLLNDLGYRKAAGTIRDNIKDYPEIAEQMLYFYNHFLVKALTDPLGTVHCDSLEYLSLMAEVDVEGILAKRKLEFPCEIGTFLTKKLTLFPESFQSCLDVMERYDTEGVSELVGALSNAVLTSSEDITNTKLSALNQVLDNTWKEAKELSLRIKGVSSAISIGLGMIGGLAGESAGGAVGGSLGLLAGLGFKVLDDKLELLSEGIAHRLARKTVSKSVSAVFDFQRKHSLQ
jgi:hypothetical protein